MQLRIKNVQVHHEWHFLQKKLTLLIPKTLEIMKHYKIKEVQGQRKRTSKKVKSKQRHLDRKLDLKTLFPG